MNRIGNGCNSPHTDAGTTLKAVIQDRNIQKIDADLKGFLNMRRANYQSVRTVMFLRKLGFSLIELLVVIALLAVLTCLLLPALSKAKASAYPAKCKSNLHQIGLGLRIYVDDQGFYPKTSAGVPWPC